MDASKRTRLLKAAVKVFARDGFFKAKVEEIARMANVATGTTYLYFENKDDLLISIFEEEMVPIIEAAEKAVSGQTTAFDKIVAFITNHLRMVQESPDMAQLLEVELRQSSKFIHTYSGTKFKEYLDIIARIVAEGQENGEFRSDIHPSIFKQMLFGAIDQICLNWTLSKSKKYDLEKSGKQIAAITLNGISNR